MRHKTTEKELLNKALQCLKKVVPIGKTRTYWKEVTNDIAVADAVVQFGELLKDFQIEIRHQVGRRTIGAIQVCMERLRKPCTLVTRYMTPPLAEEFRRRDIQFLDTAGNMLIRQKKPFVFAFVTGRRIPGIIEERRPVKLFREAGLRVLFVLLCNPEAEKKTYREIADMTGVALGTVSNVFADLKRNGFIRTFRGGRILDRRENLIDAWTEAFPNELKPRLNPRRYITNNKDWWRNIDMTKFDALLGGEPAAAILTGYLHPEAATVYIGKRFFQFARALRLRKDNHGNILVLDKFWRDAFQTPEHPGLAPPLLVYADLVAADGARNLETAQMIRKQFLA